MNRAARLEAGPNAACDGEHRARILSAAGDSLSCVFPHLRDSPAATSRIRPPPTAGVGGGAEAADKAPPDRLAPAGSTLPGARHGLYATHTVDEMRATSL
jgi:hypothetical protein